MVITTRAKLLLLAVLAISPLVVEAHHGGSMFEPQKEITLTGVVKEFQYTNPHAWLLIDVSNQDGSVTTWGFESEGPGVLMRNGIHKSDLAPGMKVTVTTHPMKDGTPAGSWVKAVRLSDGVTFDPRLKTGTPTPAPDAGAPAAGNGAAPTR